MTTQRFKTTLLAAGKTTTGIVVPEKVVEALGGGRKPAVVVTVNGYTYRSSIAVMGDKFMIGVSAERRAESGLSGGDAIDVTLALDDAPRVMDVPPDLQKALDRDKAAKAYFATLSYSNQRRHIDPINAAKAPETRARRIEKSVALFHEGKN
jgi:Bacteriocin-protection, YdeI or OmpD-Associated/Domain of unknown function (DUF1905)